MLIVGLFLLLINVIFFVRIDGATASILHLATRISAIVGLIFGFFAIAQGAAGASTILAVAVIIGNLAIFIRLQTQYFTRL